VDDALRGQRLILGCTGDFSASHLHVGQADSGTIFGSLSSADIEFQATNWSMWGTLDVLENSFKRRGSDDKGSSSARDLWPGWRISMLSAAPTWASGLYPRSLTGRLSLIRVEMGEFFSGHQAFIVTIRTAHFLRARLAAVARARQFEPRADPAKTIASDSCYLP